MGLELITFRITIWWTTNYSNLTIICGTSLNRTKTSGFSVRRTGTSHSQVPYHLLGRRGSNSHKCPYPKYGRSPITVLPNIKNLIQSFLFVWDQDIYDFFLFFYIIICINPTLHTFWCKITKIMRFKQWRVCEICSHNIFM